THKIFNPAQDVRYHQDGMPGGYSGRSVDTKYVTPFLKKVKFPSMAESGWLTRSLEQSHAYDFSYPGKIEMELKKAFLTILDDVEAKGRDPYPLLVAFFLLLAIERDKKTITLAKPVNIGIHKLISYLSVHFHS